MFCQTAPLPPAHGERYPLTGFPLTIPESPLNKIAVPSLVNPASGVMPAPAGIVWVVISPPLPITSVSLASAVCP